jgi:hypothetical protein
LIALTGETGLGDALDTKPVDRKHTARSTPSPGKCGSGGFAIEVTNSVAKTSG